MCKDFAHTWDFKHVHSSPHYPQSNGLVESAVRSVKHLLEKCYCDHTDIRAALPHIRNLGLPSSAQCLFSRQTPTFLPMTKPMLQPVIHTDVKETITKQRMRGKDYYDRNAHQLLALKPGQTVRMQTARGFDRLAIVNSPAEQPNSYVVTSQGTKYIRNRRHLLHISESPPADLEDDLPVVTDAEALSAPPKSEGSIQQPQSPKMDCYGDTDGKCSVVTRSGRVSCPNQRFKDYVMT